ncbi:MAG: EF-hand domain-containing protein [Planctomycetia bacterium]|nr:EF-hand domain-containing protein [Planctomycetia bacterium]
MKRFVYLTLAAASFLLLTCIAQAQPGGEPGQAPQGGPQGRGPRPAFLTDDGSIDLSKLTVTERMPAEQIENMKAADADGDGLLTRDEMRNGNINFGGRGPGMPGGMAGGAGGSGMLRWLFRDAVKEDGRLKIADVTKILKKFDKNKDGYLNDEELQAFAAASAPRGPSDGSEKNQERQRTRSGKQSKDNTNKE